jgi:hypothetical protein
VGGGHKDDRNGVQVRPVDGLLLGASARLHRDAAIDLVAPAPSFERIKVLEGDAAILGKGVLYDPDGLGVLHLALALVDAPEEVVGVLSVHVASGGEGRIGPVGEFLPDPVGLAP